MISTSVASLRSVFRVCKGDMVAAVIAAVIVFTLCDGQHLVSFLPASSLTCHQPMCHQLGVSLLLLLPHAASPRASTAAPQTVIR